MAQSNPKLVSFLSTIVAPITIASAVALVSVNTQAAQITEASVQKYASNMKLAANNKNISKVSSLVSDDALISLSRNGKKTSLDKSAYLKLLQESWSQTQNYKYNIQISNIVTSGEQAKADVFTVETWVKDGRKTKLTTSSRATLKSYNNNAILLRAVSQITIE